MKYYCEIDLSFQMLSGNRGGAICGKKFFDIAERVVF